jgi:hypothetical protein
MSGSTGDGSSPPPSTENWTFLRSFAGASPPVHPPRVNSRGLPPFGIAVPPAILVPSPWFQPTSTVSSALRTPVSCNRRRTRFAAFPWGLRSDAIGFPIGPGQAPSTSPRRTSHPSKNLRPERSRARATHPPEQPRRVTATLASLPFSRLRGFAPLRGPAISAPPLPAVPRSLVLPWVLFPSEALAAHRCPMCPSRGAPGRSHRLRGVCPGGALTTVAGRWPPWGS